jgi:hypothetical protein
MAIPEGTNPELQSKDLTLHQLGIAGYVSICVQLYCVGFHCLSLRFGLHGHLQVCRIFYFHMLEGFCFAAPTHVKVAM